MSSNAARWVRGRPDLPRAQDLSPEERKALARLQREARENGAVLTTDGKGGLPPSLVLGVFRRDGYQCKVHGDRGEGDFGGLQLHHIGGVDAPTSRWMQTKGHSNDPNNLVVLCALAHDSVHDDDRVRVAEGEGR